MVLEKTPYPDLFILSVPKWRSRRSTTTKPRTAILKRLRSEFKIQEVEAQEILSRQKRDFINPKEKRNRYLSDDQDSRSRNGENRNIRQPAIGLVNKYRFYNSLKKFSVWC